MSTKSKEWQAFKKVREDICSDYTTGEGVAIKQKWVNECLKPLGFKHEFEFIRCKETPEDQKTKLFIEWTALFKDGKFNPDRKSKKKKAPAKRGSAIEDLSLDEPVDEQPDVNVSAPTNEEEIAEEEELGDEPAEQPEPVTKQPKIIDELNKKNVDAMKKHKEELTMPKSKKELLLEAINALEEEENAGITEEQVEEISKRIAVKVLTDLFSEISETITSTLSSYVEDTKNQ
jgi:hypothetical protein